MKSLYRYLSAIALSTVVCASLAINANAQHGHSGGGGGHSSGGGGRSSGGGFSGHVSAAPSSRPSFSRSPASNSPARTNNSVRFNSRQGAVSGQRNAPAYAGGHIGTTQRTGVTAQSMRTYSSRSGYARPGGYLPGTNAAYHYNNGGYSRYYRPRLGFSIAVLPYGYYPFYFGDYEYYYCDGLFYQDDNDEYTVVEPPVGAQVTSLPSDAQSIIIDGQQFYEADGVYYKPVTKDDGTLVYVVAGEDGELNTGDDTGSGVNSAPPAPQIGDIVEQLPPNCNKINVNGQQLYLSQDGIYYQATTDQNGNAAYKIVGLPDDQDGGQSNQ